VAVTFGTLKLRDGEWEIDARPHVLIRIKRMFERSYKSSGALTIKNTDEVCRDLQWLLGRYPLEMNPTELRYLNLRAKAYDAHVAQFEGLVSGAIVPRAFDLALPLREYQKIAADLALRTKGLLIADDVGIGKTVMGIAMLCDPETRPALVVTLTHLPLQWQREFHKFAPNLLTHIIKKGKPYHVDRPPGRHDFLKPKRQYPDVLISNYHKLSGWAEVLAGKIRTVIFDEVHELRRVDSDKARAAREIAEKAEWRVGLSATPILNYGNEFFNVIDVLQPGTLGSQEEFLREWCSGPRSDDKARIIDPRSFGAYLREQGIMLRRTRKDVARELPEIVKIPHRIDCNMKVLNEAEDAASELARIIVAQDTAWDKRGQATRDFDVKLRQATGIAKASFVADFVRLLVESEEKVVVFAWHRAVYEILLERLKQYNPVMYTGSESPVQKDESRRRFIEGESPILLMSLRAGAGLDGLQESCHTVVFAELDWSPGIHEQAAGRIHRDGQTESVIVYYLISDEGSDPIVSDVLGIKREQIEGVRDPDAELVEKLQTDDDHIKRLAAAYLDKTRAKKAVAAVAVVAGGGADDDGGEEEERDEDENRDGSLPSNVIPLRPVQPVASEVKPSPEPVVEAEAEVGAKATEAPPEADEDSEDDPANETDDEDEDGD